MPRQQAKLFDQLVQTDGHKLRLRRSGKIEDLFHDFIQVLHLLSHHFRIPGPRVALRKLQIERVVEHFHYRQRIADFVRDLGREQTERGELFVLAHLLLNIDNPLVEPRLFDSDGGQIGEREKNADLFIGKDMRLAGIDAQRADGLSAEDQRHAQQ